MAQITINQLELNDAASDDLVLPVDSGTVTTKMTLLQLKEYILAGSSSLPPGAFFPYGGAVLPEGFYWCNGDLKSRVDDAALFAAIGTAWGSGDDSTTFRLPDIRGRFVRGTDSGAGEDPNAASRIASNYGGNSGDNVGSVQGDSLGGHRHFSVHSVSTGAGTGLSSGNSMAQAGTVSTNSGNYSLRAANTSEPTVSRTSISGGAETRPINAGAPYIIKY